MYGPILSVLLMGMFPVWGVAGGQQGLSDLSVAPPAPELSAELPVLTMEKKLSASGVLVMDLESGQTLYQRSATVRRPMASLTKLMTALLIIENHTLDELVTVPPEAGAMAGSVAHLSVGDRYSVGDLLSALLVASANDAAVTLARYHSGTVKNFVTVMNERARELGLKDTSFVNPVGLDAPDQQASPRDVALLASYLWSYKDIAKRMGLRTVDIYGAKSGKITLSHTHVLMHTHPEIIAGKTGTTEGAGQCVLSIVEHKGRLYMVVILDSGNRYEDLRTVLSALSI